MIATARTKFHEANVNMTHHWLPAVQACLSTATQPDELRITDRMATLQLKCEFNHELGHSTQLCVLETLEIYDFSSGGTGGDTTPPNLPTLVY